MILASLLFAATTPESVDPALTQTVTTEETVDRESVVELDSGHVDLGPYLTEDGWEFMARDDTQPDPVWRSIDHIVFRVSTAGKMTIPEGDEYSFIDGSDVYVVPQQEIPGVVWLGWNTLHPEVVRQVNGTVTLVFEGHEGPGHFTTFVQSGNFSGPEKLWDSSEMVSQPISVELNTHTHANWVFTEPGIHHVRINAQATLTDGSTQSETQVLTFAVGDVPLEEAIAALPTGDEADPSVEDGTETSAEQREDNTTVRSETSVSEQTSSAPETGRGVAGIAGIAGGAVALALIGAGVLATRRKAAKASALEGR